jgi:hypothetical protein
MDWRSAKTAASLAPADGTILIARDGRGETPATTPTGRNPARMIPAIDCQLSHSTPIQTALSVA